MFEWARAELGFVLEELDQLRHPDETVEQPLDRKLLREASRPPAARQIDPGHPALCDEAVDVVVTDPPG